MDETKSVRLGVAGLGGYAARMADLVLEHGAGVEPSAQLVAVCDPALDLHAERVADLKARGVTVYDDYGSMIDAADLDGVWLPVPIALHVPFAERALKAGVAVMVEKPVAGTVDELDRLIAARDAAGLPVLVGFQDIYAPQTLPMKRRLLAGELGEVEAATLRFVSPRNLHYFTRNDWAGSLRRHDTWTLDSPVNNAMAHFVNLMLFLLGPSEEQSAALTAIEAELYRAADIENYDTASLRVHLDGGPSLLVLMSHAAAKGDGPAMHIHGTEASIDRDFRRFGFTRRGAPRQDIEDVEDFRFNMLEAFTRAIRGLDQRTAVATLEVARAHTLVVNGASQASPVRPIPPSFVETVGEDGGQVQTIPGLIEAFRHGADQNQMLHESGQLGFTAPAGRLDLAGYDHFAGPHPETRPTPA